MTEPDIPATEGDRPERRMVGDAGAMACAGDPCAIPAAAPASVDIEQLDA